ncbi:MAG TPA: methanogenesis marker 2 protein [Methanobacterium sp.]|nr:methanogenesis marker 2 protein [Methanobacterium sp.]
MDLNTLIDSIRNFEGIKRKNTIKDITGILDDTYNIAGNTILSFGDDASAIDIGNGKLALLAADGMWGKLMEADPRWAGYCSVLVNVNDIAAMGGNPIGMTNVLSTENDEIRREIMEGIKEGVQKFGVPMVGGHFHPDTPYNALDVSITGIVDSNAVITSSGAEVGDKIIIAIDIDGEVHPKFDLNWDTTTMKSAEMVQSQIKIMNKLGHEKLVTAGKDISNPGTLGTLGMLLETSGIGAEVELEKIPKNENIEWDQWLKMYPGAGFVLTSKEDTVDRCIDLLESVNIKAAVCGEIIEKNKLYLSYKGEKEILFDFKDFMIIGIKEEVTKL